MRPERPDCLEAYQALSRKEQVLWWKIDQLERELLEIQEKRKKA